MEDHTLEVWYQPLWDVNDDSFPYLEALLRLPDGTGSYFPACQVIAVAEQNSIMEQVGDYVLEQTCRFVAECREKYMLKSVGINLSVQQLLVNNCVNHILERIHAAGLDPRFINLEITESILIQSVDKAADILKKLQQAGVSITLDDFGNGYSGLNYLSNLPVNTIKIDRSLIHHVLDSPKQRSLLSTIITMAEINNLSVVVEGVETQEELDLICEFGVDYIQGYYFAKPMPRHELEKFLQQKLEIIESI